MIIFNKLHGKILLLSKEGRLEIAISKELDTLSMKKENLEESGSKLRFKREIQQIKNESISDYLRKLLRY